MVVVEFPVGKLGFSLERVFVRETTPDAEARGRIINDPHIWRLKFRT